MDIPHDTTDLFGDVDEEDEESFFEKIRKYPEFSLSFPVCTPEPSLLLNTQKTTDKIEQLSGDSVHNKFEDSMFVHPQMKDEPLDLSFTSNLFKDTKTSKVETEFTLDDDLTLEFSADPFFPTDDAENKWKDGREEEDPYQVGPSTSRGHPIPMDMVFSTRNNSPTLPEEDPYQVGPSTSRKPPPPAAAFAAPDPYQVGPSTSRNPPAMEFSVDNELTAFEDENPKQKGPDPFSSTSHRQPRTEFSDDNKSTSSEEPQFNEDPQFYEEPPKTLRQLPKAFYDFYKSHVDAELEKPSTSPPPDPLKFFYSNYEPEPNPDNEKYKSNSTPKTAMDFLTLSYSQISLEDAAEPPYTNTNTQRILHPSQNPPQKDTTKIPSSVIRLYETIKVAYSDFAFVYSLASQLCQDWVPMECFVHLKIGLLLSIASLEDNIHRPPISVVAIGPEFKWASLLMEKIGDLAPRFVGPDDGFKVPKPRITKKEPYVWVYADSIVCGKGGIYYVGDWSRLKAPRSFKIFKTIQTGVVALEQTTVTCPLETAVWTHWRSYLFNAKDEDTYNKFIDIFGIPLMIEDDNHEALVDLMLWQASVKKYISTKDELSINDEDMREYLSVICKRRMDLSDEASEILKKYFVSSRIDRPDILSRKSYETLKIFSESFAKLSLRREVIMIDAIGAIYMTENFIQDTFGPGRFPPPEFKTHSCIAEVDEHMVKFQEWVNAYVLKFEGD